VDPTSAPHREEQRNHSDPLIAARAPGIVGAVAVQSGNLEERDPATGRRVTAEELYRFAREKLRLDDGYWSAEEPDYPRGILPFLERLSEKPPTAAAGYDVVEKP